MTAAEWKLVPVEPTEEMFEAWERVQDFEQDRLKRTGSHVTQGSWLATNRAAYAAMLAASPAPSPLSATGGDDLKAVAREAIEDWKSRGGDYVDGPDWPLLESTILSALQAERERCARIADEWAEFDSSQRTETDPESAETISNETARRIAEAIRGGEDARPLQSQLKEAGVDG